MLLWSTDQAGSQEVVVVALWRAGLARMKCVENKTGVSGEDALVRPRDAQSDTSIAMENEDGLTLIEEILFVTRRGQRLSTLKLVAVVFAASRCRNNEESPLSARPPKHHT